MDLQLSAVRHLRQDRHLPEVSSHCVPRGLTSRTFITFLGFRLTQRRIGKITRRSFDREAATQLLKSQLWGDGMKGTARLHPNVSLKISGISLPAKELAINASLSES